jgi:hypothetical protein
MGTNRRDFLKVGMAGLAGGGSLIASGHSGLAPDGQDFALGDPAPGPSVPRGRPAILRHR